MRRRDFLSLAALSLPPLAAPGAERVRRIAWVSPGPTVLYEMLKGELAKLGWGEARNVAFDARYSEAGGDALRAETDAAIQAGADVILAAGSKATLAAQRATHSVPIVAVVVTDPVGLGMVRSLARPEGNVTGVSNRGEDLAPKKIELLRSLTDIKRLGVFYDPSNEGNEYAVKRNDAKLVAWGLAPVYLPVHTEVELEARMQEALKARVDAISIGLASVLNRSGPRIASFALSNRLPSAANRRGFVESGGLLSFGQDDSSIMRTAAGYVDKLLKGAKVADLPFQRADKLEFGLNLKTARALRLTVPREIAARADFVID